MLKRKDTQKGFTLVEIVAAVGILAAVMLGFSTLLGSVGSAQQIIERERVATRALSNEVEKIQAIRWDDLMPRPVVYSSCEIDDLRTGYPAVVTEPEVLSVGRVNVTVTREIRWYLSDTPVSCSEADKNKAEPKVVLITATWDNGRGKTMSLETQVVRSRWSEGPTNLDIGTKPSLEREISMASATNWCPIYNEGGASLSGGSATSTGTTVQISFAKNNAVCGVNVTGLISGNTYTAVMEVFVPQGSQPVELGIQDGTRGGVAPADGNWYTLTATWTQSGTSNIIGPKVQKGMANPGFSQAIVRQLDIFKH